MLILMFILRADCDDPPPPGRFVIFKVSGSTTFAVVDAALEAISVLLLTNATWPRSPTGAGTVVVDFGVYYVGLYKTPT